jgi:hypothetical protein
VQFTLQNPQHYILAPAPAAPQLNRRRRVPEREPSMPAQTPRRITRPDNNSTTKTLAGPRSNPRRPRTTVKPRNSGRASHESRTRIARHTMSSKFRSISLKTKKSDTNKVTHFSMTGLPVSSAKTKGGRAWEIGTAQTLLPALRPAVSRSNVSVLLRIPRNNKQPQAQKKCHTMQSDFPSISLKTKKSDTNKVTHFFEGVCHQSGVTNHQSPSLCPLTGQVGTGSNMSDYPTYQDLRTFRCGARESLDLRQNSLSHRIRKRGCRVKSVRYERWEIEDRRQDKPA